jgi:hypothetical protein
VEWTSSASVDPDSEDYNGFGVLYAGNNQAILKANILKLQTGWIDFGQPELMKGFYEFHWSVSRNSSGVVCLCFETDQGVAKHLYYGEVFGKERHKVLTMLHGAAVRVTFTVLLEGNKNFAVRDWTILWKEQGRK